MSVKKWILVFFASLLGFAALLALFNAAVDPFGVFGDRLMQWYAYDMTQNPRVAKIAWLEQHHQDYDSYVIGSSKASSLSVDTLNAYTGDRYYNMTWYGGDLKDEAQLAHYLIEHYDIKNIILTFDPECANYYDNGSQSDLKTCMHSKASGNAVLPFYGRYLFANLSYSWDKLISCARSGILPDASCVYIPETGCYNKIQRDASPINDMASYLAYEGLSGYVAPCTMEHIDEAVAAIYEIRQLCLDNGVSFTLVGIPVSDAELAAYPREGVTELAARVAEFTDFYCFWGRGGINADLRYFYDEVHFRNNVGDMVLATLFGDMSVYVPEGFGTLTTAENVAAVVAAAYDERTDPAVLSADVAILMYHSFTENEAEADGTRVLLSDFEDQLRALRCAGYTSVGYQDLLDFVYGGAPLPEKAVLISIDDGYQDNLDLAAPLLAEYGFSANIAVIGVSVGHTTYKDTIEQITPHFALAAAQPWVERGVLTLTTHSYDMHQVASLDGENCREGALQMSGERPEDYAAALAQDYAMAQQQLSDVVSKPLPVYTYPYGFYSELSEIVLHELGARATVTIDYGANQLLKGSPQSLYRLRRINVEGGLEAGELLERVDNAIQTLH